MAVHRGARGVQEQPCLRGRGLQTFHHGPIVSLLSEAEAHTLQQLRVPLWGLGAAMSGTASIPALSSRAAATQLAMVLAKLT